MQMVIEYPAFLPDTLQYTHKQFEQEAKMVMAVKLFEMKRLSSGLAAKLAGMERVALLLALHRYGVQVNYARTSKMPDTDELVINTGPLLALTAALGDLQVLKLYMRVWIPYEVQPEILYGGS